MSCNIKALKRITDGGHNIAKGKTTPVSDGYAKEWIGRGWAEAVKEAPKPDAKGATE